MPAGAAAATPELDHPHSSDAMMRTDPRVTAVTERLSALGISFQLFFHNPLDTVEVCKSYRSEADHNNPLFGYCKNLFVRDKRGARFLIVAHEDTAVGMPHVRRVLNAARSLSMTTADELFESLGVLPGCVSPLALITDCARPGDARTVSGVLIDESLVRNPDRFSHLFFHPLVNTASIGLSPAALMEYLGALGVSVLRAELSGAVSAAE